MGEEGNGEQLHYSLVTSPKLWQPLNSAPNTQTRTAGTNHDPPGLRDPSQTSSACAGGRWGISGSLDGQAVGKIMTVLLEISSAGICCSHGTFHYRAMDRR